MNSPFAFSDKFMVCPDYLHRSSNFDYCPSMLTCSENYVLCDDNTCRKNSTLCPITRVCPKYTCPFGNCVDDYTLCFSNTVCKRGYRLCSDRLCHPRDEACPSYIDDAHAEALSNGFKLCRSGDIVSRDIICPNNVGHRIDFNIDHLSNRPGQVSRQYLSRIASSMSFFSSLSCRFRFFLSLVSS